ncbi:dicarboxylic amino acid permease, partial [Aureobasidium melanogenum]
MSKLPSDYKAQADATAVSLFPDHDVGTVSNASFGSANKDGLQRNLKPRHLQMIAIGGVIESMVLGHGYCLTDNVQGTGLFLGTGSDLAHGGPAGLLIGYCIMASLLYSVMVALGEMISHLPIPGGQFALASRFVSPAVGFGMGWLYWYNYIVVLPAELSASAVLVSYWTPAGKTGSTCTTGICNNSLWIAIFLIVVLAINFGGTRVFGEIEYWFCSIKVLTIIGLIITGIVITSGGGPDGTPIGFRYWNESGGFVQYQDIPGAKGRFLGFFSVLINAAFAFIGTEITAITAAECANPKRAVPNAIKSVWIRLVLFYLSNAFIIGLIVSPHDPDLNLGTGAAKSPFVLAMKNAGISVHPSIVNAALLTSACAFALISFMAGAKGKAGTVFGYFSNMTAICGMISWACILWTSIRWQRGLKAQGIDRNTLPYKAPFQPYLSYYGLSVSMLVTIFGGFTTFMPHFNASSFVTTYLPIPFFLVLVIGYKFWDKSKFVKYEDMDFSTGSSADILNESAPPGFWGKVEDGRVFCIMASAYDLVVINGLVVTAVDVVQCCIGVKNGKIRTLATSISHEEIGDAQIIDAEGAFVMPGGVDAHVHLCQDLKTGIDGLGGECADNFETGSRSAAAGGTTTMITFATQSRAEEDRSLLGVVEAYNARAEATGSYIDYGFHIIIVRNDADILEHELPMLVEDWGITSCKLFMTYESQRLTDSQLLDVMLASQRNEITTQKFHSPTCFENSKHVCSPPPPPKTSDQDELYIGLHNGTFTIFSSDHCPFRYDHPHGKPTGVLEDPASMKGEQACEGEELQSLVSRKPGSFRFIPNDIPGVETRLSLLYTGGLATGKITPQKFVELTSTDPAKLYGIYPKKGALMPGSDADIVIWHPDKHFQPFLLSNKMLHHNVGYTPYEGKEFVNWPRYTILRGKVIWAHGELKGKPYDGEYLRRGPSYFGTGPEGSRVDSRRTATWL